jgi:histidyl-tRNA synthetase
MAQKPSIPKGTRDFSPTEMVRRNYIFDTIKSVFQNYGYLPIETPAMENLATLMGKYGEEGDRLLFKILNSGDYLKKVKLSEVSSEKLNEVTRAISEKGLRYDLTVPFARYVVQHRNEITFPFKRYQMQPVWRADRPQKGRYREFFQCDVDVIGSDSLLNEVELIRMIDDIFSKLKMEVVIKINNRKVLSGIAEVIDAPEKLTDITTAIDKLDKIGIEKVYDELRSKGLEEETIQMLEPIINLGGDNQKKLNCLRELIGMTADGSKGIAELQSMIDLLDGLNIRSEIEIDQSLARGLNYYTGAIIEVKAKEVNIGSVCGGGRYDNLTGVFGLSDVSGVGVSFGADRIYDVLNELDLFPEQVQHTTQVMLVNFGEKEATYALGVLQQLQQAGIRAELYPDAAKMKKQMKYADQKSIRFVLLIGEQEMESGVLTLKDMESGEQLKQELEDLIEFIK